MKPQETFISMTVSRHVCAGMRSVGAPLQYYSEYVVLHVEKANNM